MWMEPRYCGTVAQIDRGIKYPTCPITQAIYNRCVVLLVSGNGCPEYISEAELQYFCWSQSWNSPPIHKGCPPSLQAVAQVCVARHSRSLLLLFCSPCCYRQPSFKKLQLPTPQKRQHCLLPTFMLPGINFSLSQSALSAFLEGYSPEPITP